MGDAELDMLYHMWYMYMSDLLKILPARFFSTRGGIEPVREWLRELDKDDCRIIGNDIRTVELGWPIGMPVCRSLAGHKDLWEVRSKLTGGRIARVIFYIRDGEMLLLHGFIKKSQKTSQNDLDLAIKRRKEYERNV
jgi:phage-related protein